MNFKNHLLSLVEYENLFKDIFSDRQVKKGKVQCNTHLFFIAGIPKSGTTWLCQLLSQSPGLVQLNTSLLRQYPQHSKLENIHDVSPQMLSCAPKNRLSFLKLHLNPYPRNFSILDDYNIRTVVLIRDLRDVLISRLHHILLIKSHWDYKRLNNLPNESRLLESMKGIIPELSVYVIDYFTSWISGWIDKASTDPEKILLIKYEEMTLDLLSVLKMIYKFYDYPISDNDINKVIIKQKMKHKNDQKRGLIKNIKLQGRAKSTFRKGIIGGWQNEFNLEICEFFKEHAGDILIKSGYENDFLW